MHRARDLRSMLHSRMPRNGPTTGAAWAWDPDTERGAWVRVDSEDQLFKLAVNGGAERGRRQQPRVHLDRDDQRTELRVTSPS